MENVPGGLAVVTKTHTFNLPLVTFSANLTNMRGKMFVLLKDMRRDIIMTVFASTASSLFIVLGVLTSSLCSCSVWDQEWDKLWRLSEKCDGKSWEKAFLFLLSSFYSGFTVCLYVWNGKISIPGGGAHSQWLLLQLHTCFTGLRSNWSVVPFYPPPLFSSFCVCIYNCPE